VAVTLGEFELLVLLACVRLGDEDAYAVSIADEIEARTGRALQRAAVYVTLQRLEKKGLVSTHLGDSRPERGGKARRLERAGRAAVRDTRQAFQRMWMGLAARLEAR
jgi:PadR family transcriptional regulator, regulatory protein PadR